MENTRINILRQKLQDLPNGSVGDDIERALIGCWDELSGSAEENTWPSKLIGRIEKLIWERPYLHFIIERHGCTAMGSSRAELHQWTVNLDTAEANCCDGGYRQKWPRSPGLKVKPLVKELAAAVVAEESVPELKWLAPERVRILIGQLIPDDGYKQTIAGRRKRFSAAMEQTLMAAGWVRVPGTAPHTYEKQADSKRHS